jgi:hypothetical protein
MTNSTMLVLVGGRSAVPTISGIIQFLADISRIKFLVCEGDEYENLQRITADFIKGQKRDIDFNVERDVRVVNPNDFTKVLKTLSELVTEEKIAFASLASAPQTMSIASYAFLARKFKSDVMMFTVSTDHAAIIPLVENMSPIPFKQKLCVEDYVVACGQEIYKRKVEDSFIFQDINKLQKLSSLFIDNIESVDSILAEIRKQVGGGDSIKSIRRIFLSNEDILRRNIAKPFLLDFLEELASSDLIEKVENSDIISFRMNPDQFDFLRGDWLELFVYLHSLKCGFDSVEVAIELANFNGEIDLFCLNNSNALICECKTGKWDKKAILKLRNLAEKLGGSYCTKVLVTSAVEVPDEIIQEAKNSKVRIISGRELSQITDILKDEMNEPMYGRR